MVRFLVDLYRALLGIVFVAGLLFAAFMAVMQPDVFGGLMIVLGWAAGLVMVLGLSAAVIRIGDEIEALKTIMANPPGQPSRSAHGDVVKVFKGQAITRQGGAFYVGDTRFGTVLDAEAWISAKQSAPREARE
ncbi:MAG: hypothetical protein CVT80_07420 [Alphaproteobacteria bacterium HGW-Alphaproteobacteria-2]|nr:MAG: hypothetical protein CVT80_07420 [Alphaproteobacteria bacterium HGW-Alphaproteobacteria-2]